MNHERARQLLIGTFSWWRVVRSAVLIYVCVMAYAWFASNGMIFPARPASYTGGPEITTLRTADGTTISALYLPNPEARFTVLYSHGNAEDIGELREFLERYRARGFAVLAYDYHGYGTSGGKPSEANAYQDILAAYAFLVKEKHVPSERIIVHGRSVGSGPSVWLADEAPVAGLIVESGFVSAFRVITRVPLVPFDRFPNLKRIGGVACPVLFLHGTADTTIPLWHGERLFEAAREPKFKRWVPEATHDDLPWSGEAYWEAIEGFAANLKARVDGDGG